MPDSLDFDATTTPQDIVSVLSLTTERWYTLFNASTTATLFHREAAQAPDPTGRKNRIEAGSGCTIQHTDAPIWFWTDDPAGCPVLVTERPR